eukprot:gene8576-9449_t
MASLFDLAYNREEEDPPPPPPPPPDSPPLTPDQGGVGEEVGELEQDREEYERSLRENGFVLRFHEEEERFFYVDETTGDSYWADELSAILEGELNGQDSPQLRDEREGERGGAAEQEVEEEEGVRDVVARSAEMLKRKEQRLANLRQSREEAELRSLREPHLTKSGRGKQRSVRDMLTWEAKRQEKLQAMAKAREDALDSDMTGRPVITRLAQRLGGADDSSSVASCSTSARSVQERLYDQHRHRRERLLALQKVQDDAARRLARPAINNRSRYIATQALQEEGIDSLSSHDRLYFRHLIRLHGRAEDAAYAQDGRLQQHDPATGQRLFVPQINRTSQTLARRQLRGQVPIEELLHNRGQHYLRRQEMRRRQLAQEDSQRRRPQVNSVSLRLAQEKEVLSGESSQDRLLRPIGNLRERTQQELEEHAPTFRPSCKSSSSITFQQQTQSSEQYYDRAMRWQERRREKMAREQQQRQREEMAECSFHPRLAPRQNSPSSSHSTWEDFEQRSSGEGMEGFGGGLAAMADRQVRWAQKRDEKLAIERRKRAQEEEKDCTFAPHVDQPPSQIYRGLRRSTVASSSRRFSPSRSLSPSLCGSLPHTQESAPFDLTSAEDYAIPHFPAAEVDYYQNDFDTLERLAQHALFTHPFSSSVPVVAGVRSTNGGFDDNYSVTVGQGRAKAFSGSMLPSSVALVDADDFSMSDAIELT